MVFPTVFGVSPPHSAQGCILDRKCSEKRGQADRPRREYDGSTCAFGLWESQMNYMKWYAIIGLNVAISSAATSAAAQTWEYLSYYPSGPKAGSLSAPGYVVLEEKSGKATFRIVAGSLSTCYENALDATVTKTETTTTITTAPRMQGCGEVRFVIKNDGSGGRREVKNGAEWVWDGKERGLTPQK